MIKSNSRHLEKNSHFNCETSIKPSAIISEKSITECNKAFATLLNISKDKIIGHSLESFCARFAEDDGTFQTAPIILNESVSPQTIFLKPKNEPPVCTSMTITTRKEDDIFFIILSFNLINAKIHKQLEDEISRNKISSQLWHVAIFDHNHITNKIYMSPLYREIYGVDSDDELSFENAGKFIHPDDRDLKDIAKAHDPSGNGLFDKAFRIIRKDGKIRWIHSKSQTFFDTIDGKRQAVRTTGAIVDFTDEYMLKKALEENKQKLADILDSLPSIILGVNNQGQITQWNKMAETHSSILDAPPENRKLEVIFPMLKDKIHQIQKAVMLDKNLEIDRILYVHDDSNSFYKVCILPHHHITNAYTDSIIRIDNITEEVRNEEKQREIETRLRQAEKMEAIGTLASGIAHDFNNILEIIIGYTELAKIGPPSSSEYQDHLNQVLGAADNAKSLVKQILTFSRQTKKQRTPIRLQSITKEALKMLRASIPAIINIKQDISPDCSTVLADAVQIHQILINICTNAYHAIGETSGTISVALRNTSVAPEKENLPAGEYVELIISDTGTGIPPDAIGQIFAPFFTTKKQGKGTGMGLAVVDNIMKEYKGGVYVDTDPEQGSSFHLFFPVYKGPELSKKTKDYISPRGNEKILYVDDEVLITEMGKILLENLGYQVTAKNSSIEALSLFRDNSNASFDIIITDQAMPQMTGVAMAKKILEINPNMPIIICSGYSDESTEKLFISTGIKEMLPKPYKLEDLARTIRKVLDNL